MQRLLQPFVDCDVITDFCCNEGFLDNAQFNMCEDCDATDPGCNERLDLVVMELPWRHPWTRRRFVHA